VKEPSKRDIENVRDGKETAVERTRRLFYVCCTRALTDLVVVYFSTDPVMAERQVRAAGIFPEHAVLNEASLS
jgi:DNA helicase II / ATP-dependent DNA helicase PcrA